MDVKISVRPEQGVQPLLCLRIWQPPSVAHAEDGVRPGKVHGKPIVDC